MARATTPVPLTTRPTGPRTPENSRLQSNHAYETKRFRPPSAPIPSGESLHRRSPPSTNISLRSMSSYRPTLSRAPTLLVEPSTETTGLGPTTPKNRPKDLTGIFDSISPKLSSSNAGTSGVLNGRGLAKRMSSRSSSNVTSSGSSLSYIDSKDSQTSLRKKEILTESSSGPETMLSPEKTPTESLDSVSTPQNQRGTTNTSSRTYAGRSRSFLVSLPVTSVLSPQALSQSQGDGSEQEDEFSRESYTDLRKRWGVDNSEVLSKLTRYTLI